MDISTGQGVEEGGERGGAKAAVKVGNKLCTGERLLDCAFRVLRILPARQASQGNSFCSCSHDPI